MIKHARKVIDVSVGDSVRVITELQGHSPNELAALTVIPRATISVNPRTTASACHATCDIEGGASAGSCCISGSRRSSISRVPQSVRSACRP